MFLGKLEIENPKREVDLRKEDWNQLLTFLANVLHLFKTLLESSPAAFQVEAEMPTP